MLQKIYWKVGEIQIFLEKVSVFVTCPPEKRCWNDAHDPLLY